jgi:hypothetical protein
MNYYPGGLVCFRRPEIDTEMNHVAGRLVKMTQGALRHIKR